MDSKHLSIQQEKQIARYLGGEVQSNSGGTKFGGGDVHTKHFLIEAKLPTCEKKSFSIKKEWIDKAREQCYEQNKFHSAVAFRFDPYGKDYYIIDQNLMRTLVKYMEED